MIEPSAEPMTVFFWDGCWIVRHNNKHGPLIEGIVGSDMSEVRRESGKPVLNLAEATPFRTTI